MTGSLAAKNVALECFLVSLAHCWIFSDRCRLNGSSLRLLVAKNVGTLATGARDRCRVRSLSELVLSALHQSPIRVVIWLIVENVRPNVVIVACGSVIVDHILVGVRQNVRPILSLL